MTVGLYFPYTGDDQGLPAHERQLYGKSGMQSRQLMDSSQLAQQVHVDSCNACQQVPTLLYTLVSNSFVLVILACRKLDVSL